MDEHRVAELGDHRSGVSVSGGSDQIVEQDGRNIIVNVPDYRDAAREAKILCAPNCCGRPRNCTITKLVWVVKIVTIVGIVVFEIASKIREKRDMGEDIRFWDFQETLALFAGMILRPKWGRVKGVFRG